MSFSLKEYAKQKETSTLDSAGSSALQSFSLRDYQEQKNIQSGQGSSAYEKLLSDLNDFSTTQENNFKSRQNTYQSANQIAANRNATNVWANRLKGQSQSVRDYYTKYGADIDSVYGEGTAQKILDQLGSIDEYLNGSGSNYDAEEKYWGQFKDKNEYDTYTRLKGYEDAKTAQDFAEKSQYKSTYNKDNEKFSALLGRYTNTGFDDITYDYINRDETARSRQTLNDIQDNSALLGLDQSFLKQMTDNQISMFNYLYSTRGKDAAYQYIADITQELQYKDRLQTQQTWADFAKERPAAMSLFSVLEKPTETLSLIGNIADVAAGNGLNQNAGTEKWVHINQAIRNEVADEVKDKWGGLGDDAYMLGMSMADSLYNMLPTILTGGVNPEGISGVIYPSIENFMLSIMGTSAAAESVVSMKDKGYSDQKAMTLGLIAGAAEYITERAGIDALMDKTLLKNSLRNYLIKSTAAEGLEEVGSDLINWLADTIYAGATGDQTEFQKMVADYEAQGYSHSDAVGKAVADRLAEAGKDFAGGAISGLLFGIGGAVIGTVGSNITQNTTGNQFANPTVEQNIESGVNIPSTENLAQRGDFQAQNGIDKSFLNEAKKILGEAGQKAIVDSYDGTVDPDVYVKEFFQMYQAGVEGRDIMARENLSAEQSWAAMVAGQNDRRGQNGEVYVRQSEERNNGENPGQQVRTVEERPGVTNRLTENNRAEQTTGLTYEKEVTTQGLGIAKGSNTDKLYIVSGQNESLKKASAVARQHGLHAVFFAGDYMTIAGNTGIRGYISNGRIFIRVDDPEFTADQITRHEAGHDSIAKGEIDLDEVRDRIDKKVGAENVQRVADLYAQAYENTGMTAEEIWEEIICDSLGDMNIFAGSDIFSKEVGEFIQAAKTEAEASEQTVRGPPKAENPDGKIKGKTSRRVEVEGQISIEDMLKNNFGVEGKTVEQTAKAIEDLGDIEIKESTNKDMERTLAVRFREDLINKGNVNLVGQTVKSAYDMAVVAQVLRDPRFETARYFFVDKNGKIVSHSGVSSRSVASVSLFPKNAYSYITKIATEAVNAGATEMYFLHNHPSGDPSPSEADINSMTSLVTLMRTFGINNTHGVIINSSKYASMEWDGSSFKSSIESLPGKDELLQGEGNTDLLTGRLHGPEDLSKIAKTVQLSDDYSVMVFLNAKMAVCAVQEIHNSIIKDQVKFAEYYDRNLSRFGAMSAAMVTNDEDVYIDSMPLYARGMLVDVTYPDSNTSLKEQGHWAHNPISGSANEYWSRADEGKFSMKAPVENTQKMIAWHNMNPSALKNALELGGLAMPSFAVMPDNKAHTTYGDISIVARKNSVAPNGRSQVIYGGDAWTPIFPTIDYKVNQDAGWDIYDKADEAANALGINNSYGGFRPSFDQENFNDYMQRSGGDFAAAYRDDYGLKLAFMKDNGINVNVPYKDIQWSKYVLNEDIEELMNKLPDPVDVINDGDLQEQYEPVLREYVRKYHEEVYGKDLADRLYGKKESLSFNEMYDILQGVNSFKRKTSSQKIDIAKLKENIDAELMDEAVNAEYEKWLADVEKKVYVKRAIRNNKDVFTNSGNRRSFDALHFDYSLDNIVKAMQSQPKQGRTGFLTGASAVKGASLKSYKNIEEVRAELDRIISEGETEKFKAAYDVFVEHVRDAASKINPDVFNGADDLAEILSHAKTKNGIRSYLNKEFAGFVDITDDLVNEIYEIGQEANTLPMGYFEAKLYRAFRFDEAAAVVVPSDLDQDLVSQLEEQGANVLTYEAGNNEDRLAKVNSVEGAKFSQKVDADGVKLTDAQIDFFSKSKIRNDEGRLIKVWHGSPKDFTVFDTELWGAYFSENKWYSERYARKSDGSTGNLNSYYLNMTRPFDTRIPAIRKIWENEFYRKYGNGAPLSDIGLPDWTDGDDLVDFARERGYDGVVLYEGSEFAEAQENGLRSRGISYIILDPNQAKLTSNQNPTDDPDIRYSRKLDPKTDKELLASLNSQKTMKVYRAMQLIDGKLYPPMAARIRVNGKKALQEASEIGRWEEAVENPDLRREGKFELDKANGSSLYAAYNPYIHTSGTPLNDQFSSAHRRPNLVTVEGEIPVSELTSGYRAEGAKNAVGENAWHAGPVASKLKGDKARKVYLSRWFRPVRIVPDAEVAKIVADTLRGENISVPYNVVTPSLRAELEKQGVVIEGKTSRRAESLEQLSSENQAMREKLKEFNKIKKELAEKTRQAEYWKGQTQLTKSPTIRMEDAQTVAKDITSGYDSTLKASDIAGRVKDLGDFIVSTDNLDWNDVKNKAIDIARDVVQNASALQNGDDADLYKQLKKIVRDGKGIYISPKEQSNFADYGETKKSWFGTVKISSTGTPLDSVYQELSQNPGLSVFFPEGVTDSVAQMEAILEAMQSLAPIYENPYSYNMAEAVEYCANDIINSLLDESVRQTAPTYADRMNKKLEKSIYKERQKAAEKQAQTQAKAEKEISEAKARANEAVRKAREQRDARIKDLKDHYAEVAKNRAERRADSASRQRLLKIAKRLQNKKLPAVSRALLDQYIGDLDTVAVSITQKKLDNLMDLRMWYEEQKDPKVNPDFISDPRTEKALERLSKRRISDLTSEEVLELTEVLLNIENEIRTERKFINSKMNIDTYYAGEKTIQDVKNTMGSKKNFADMLITNALSPVRAVRRIVGYKVNDPMLIATNELADGQRDMIDYQRRSYHQFNEWTEDKKFIESISGKKSSPVTITGWKNGKPASVKITRAMLMSLYLHSLNDQNLRHIKEGGIKVPDLELLNKGDVSEAYARGTTIKMTPSQIRALIPYMTTKERAFARAAHAYFNGQSQQEINDVSEALNGYSVAQVEDYFPINTDSNFTRADFEALKFDGTIEGMGFLKERIDAKNPILLREMTDVLNQSINMTSKYVGLAIPVRNFNKLWNVTLSTQNMTDIDAYTDSVKQAINQRWGSRAVDYIEKMMTDLQNGGRKTDEFGQLLNRARGNYAQAVLSLNLSVAMKQAASYPTAAAVVGWGPLMKALGNVGKVNTDLIERYTPLLWYRSQGFSTTELGDLKKRGKQVPAVLNWIQAMDLATTKKLWKAAEYYVNDNYKDLQKGSDEYYTQVADVYNRIIEETQPNYTTMQRPQLLRSDNSLVQNTIAMFKTQPLQNFNVLYDAIGNFEAASIAYLNVTKETQKAVEKQMDEAKANLANAVTSQVVQLAVFSAMTYAWNMLRRKKDKYEDEDGNMTFWSITQGIGKDMLSGAASMIPLGAEVYELAAALLTGEKYYGSDVVATTAISDALQAVYNLGTLLNETVGQLSSEEDADVDWSKIAKKTLSAFEDLSKLFGIPVQNIMNLYDIVYHNTAVWASGRYAGEYNYLKSQNASKTKIYDILYKAYVNDKEQYREIKSDMLKDGYTEKNIENNLQKRIEANRKK